MKMFQQLSSVTVFLLLYTFKTIQSQEEAIRGHMQPLGMHRDPEGHVDTYEYGQFPTPVEFWTKYVKAKRPVMFRGAANISPAVTMWTDEYLLNNYGDLQVKLEAKLEKKFVPVGNVGLGRDTIRYFLQTYHQRDVYIVSQLPSPMAKDFYVPPVMTCGSFKDRIMEANLWISNGGSSSLLHKDALNTLNCLINGTKNWIMISSEHIANIPMAIEPESEIGGFSMLNVDRVNLRRYPKFREVPWHYANVTPGDCLYIPTGYLHQVRSTGPKNVAVSLLAEYYLVSLNKFNNAGCDNPKHKLLNESNVVYDYPGYGSMTMGSPSVYYIRDRFIAAFKNKKVKSSQFIKFLLRHTLINDDSKIRFKNQIDTYNEFFKLDEKEYITQKDIKDLSFDQWKSLVVDLDPDPANREDFEYYYLDRMQIKRLLEQSTDKETGNLDVDNFLKSYLAISGSKPFGNKNIAILDSNSDNQVNKEELRENMEKVLQLYDTRDFDVEVKVDDYSYLEGRDPDYDSESRNENEENDDEDEEDDESDNLREQNNIKEENEMKEKISNSENRDEL